MNHPLNHKHCGPRIFVLAAMAGILLAVAPADAQPERPWGGTRESVEPAIMKRDLTHMVEHLQLTGDQKLLVETLFADYEAAISAGAKAMRDRVTQLRPARPKPDERTRQRQAELREEIRTVLEEARQRAQETDDPEERRAIMEEYQQRVSELRDEMRGPRPQIDPEERRRRDRQIGEVVEAWNAEKRRLGDKFIADVKTLLSDDQLALWPALERRLRREKTMQLGQLSGEMTNLFHIVPQIELDPEMEEAIAPVLEAYDVRLDAALKARNDLLAESRQKITEAAAAGDDQAALAMADRQMTTHKAVRDVNEEYTQAIAAALGPELGEQFTQLVNERAFPRIYRATGVQRLFEEAADLPGLDKETWAAVESLKEGFLAALAPRNAELRRLTLLHEPKQIRRRLNPGAAASEGEMGGWRDDPLRDAQRDHREFEASYAQRLKALLTAEQFKSLPGARRWIDPSQWPRRGEPGPRGDAGSGR